MYQNKLTNNYNNFVKKPSNYMNNQILNNNHIYSSNIYDRNFHQQMQMAKREQMKKIRNISDLKMSKEQITEYVIAPIKVERNDSRELRKLYDDEQLKLTDNYIREKWWNNRTNMPYKNILKNENWNKDFRTQKDLIVHKVSKLDKIGLIDDYNKLVKMLEKHNDELKVVYSSSKETEHKKKFKYVNKYKYRYKYDPKNFKELQKYYKEEQRKHDEKQKRYENIITKLMDGDINKKELKQLENEFMKTNKGIKSSKKINKTMNKIDKELEELMEQVDEHDLNEILNETNNNKVIKKKDNKTKETNKNVKKIRITKITKNKKSDNTINTINNKKVKKIRIGKISKK
jgi:hypothetical protein